VSIGSQTRRSWRTVGRLAALLATIFAAACTTLAPLPPPPADPAAFTHDAYGRVLASVVGPNGLVDYAALAADPDDLERHYARLAAISPDSQPDAFPTPESRLAYWLNAYNAAVLTAVVRRWPIDSVRDVPPPLLGFFVRQRVVLGGRKLSLYELENGLVRTRFDEPRIHFALNCASLGCPRLPATPFTAAGLDAELDRETRRFVAAPRNVRVEQADGVIHLSSIFDWYDDDFTDWLRRHRPDVPPTLPSYVRLYANEELQTALDACARCRVEFIPYDWTLNARPSGDGRVPRQGDSP
jgi:hypothetical protein